MQSSVLVGFVLGALLVAGWYFVPVTMDDAGRATAIQADEQAELARRQLERFSPIANTADKYLDSDAAQEMVASGDFTKWSTDAEAEAEKHKEQYAGIDQAPPAPPTATPEAMRSGVQAFESQKAENNSYLTEAISNARQAAQLVSSQPRAHINLIQGAANMTEAYDKLRDAERVRVDVEATLYEAFKYAIRERYQRDKQAYYSALDTEPIIADLLNKEFGKTYNETELEAVDTQLAAVSEELSARESELDDVSEKLSQAQQERLQLETQRSEGGISFQDFRSSYGNVMTRLATLQEQEQLLTRGGLRGAKVDITDPVNGPITGGEPVRGTEELAAEKARLEAVRERLMGAVEEIENQVQQVQKSAELNAATANTYSLRAGEFKDAMIQAQSDLAKLTTEAFELEDAALKASRAARGAFEQADRAIVAFQRKARETRSASDPEGQNQRLQSIINDKMVTQIGKSAEAAARVLEARILLLRMESVERQRQILQKIVQLANGELTDEQTLTDLITASRKEGRDTLNEAIKIYEQLSSDENATVWADLAGQGAAVYLKSRFDAANGPQIAYEATRIMQQAIEGRQQSPYLAKHVLFYNYLADKTDFSPSSSSSSSETTDPNASGATDSSTTTEPNAPTTSTTEDDPFGS